MGNKAMKPSDQRLVSIMVITYNQKDFVREAVLSAVNQDYRLLEVVVSDDGSTDGTAEILDELAQQYPDRLKVLSRQGNLGITGNSNRGLRACSGDLIAFQGGDDVLLPGKISSQARWFGESEKRIYCYHDVEVFDSATNTKICNYNDMVPLISGYGASELIRRMKLGASTSVMVRRSAIAKRAFDPRLPVVSDWKLWIDILADGGEYGFVSGVYARYRRHGGNSRLVQSDQYRTDCYVTVALAESEYPQYSTDIRVAHARVIAVHALHEAFSGRHANAWKLWRISARNALLSLKYPLGIIFSMLPLRLQRFLVRHLKSWIPELAYAQH
jgi:glycosyltransferase involved in cell wall biosynthesis